MLQMSRQAWLPRTWGELFGSLVLALLVLCPISGKPNRYSPVIPSPISENEESSPEESESGEELELSVSDLRCKRATRNCNVRITKVKRISLRLPAKHTLLAKTNNTMTIPKNHATGLGVPLRC